MSKFEDQSGEDDQDAADDELVAHAQWLVGQDDDGQSPQRIGRGEGSVGVLERNSRLRQLLVIGRWLICRGGDQRARWSCLGCRCRLVSHCQLPRDGCL